MRTKEKNKPKKIIWISAGGTGGHISPGFALAKSFTEKGFWVVFITLMKDKNYADIQKMEQEKKIKIVYLPASKIPKSISEIFFFLQSHRKSQKILNQEAKKEMPSSVLGMGGYPSFPAVWFAYRKKIPYFLSEQNAHAGVVTRLMAARAKSIYLAFPYNKTAGLKKWAAKCRHVGNALRPMFVNFKGKHKKTKWPPKNILMIGGSQGARDINELYLQLNENHLFENTIFTLSTGPAHFETIKRQARKKDRIFPFIKEVAHELINTDLIVARSGSGTLFEIAWSHKPSILMPYPLAKDDHQRQNALALAANGPSEILDIRPYEPKVAAKKFIKWVNKNPFQKFFDNDFFSGANAKPVLPLNATATITNDILTKLNKYPND